MNTDILLPCGYVGYVFVCVCIFTTCLFLLEPSCFFHSEGTVVADHYREGDRGRLEFRRACLRLGPLLNERCSILLIMLLRLMSLSADGEECNKPLLLFWLFAFLIGLNKSIFLLLVLPFTFLVWNGICFSGLFGYVFMFSGVSLRSCFVSLQCHCYETALFYHAFLNSSARRPVYNKISIFFATHRNLLHWFLDQL